MGIFDQILWSNFSLTILTIENLDLSHGQNFDHLTSVFLKILVMVMVKNVCPHDYDLA